MPKNKKSSSESESDSDSGPDDRNQPAPAKKSKSDDTKASSKNDPKTNWTIDKLKQVNINEFRGKKMVDIREYYEKDGKLLPGKKGISLTISQWQKLLEIAEEVTANFGA